jgi:tight adherence protein C
MTPLLLTLIAAASVVSFRLFTNAAARRRSVQLVDHSIETDAFASAEEVDEGRLVTWLARAGYRDPAAASTFLGATAGLTAFALAAVFILDKVGATGGMVQALSEMPGGFTDVLAPIAKVAAVIIVITFASLPALVVRSARRKRVEAIEQDLAPTLELLATLAEAGLGFDSAIARIQESDSGTRPLGQEFQIYQRDNLGGIPRLESLRKLGRRVNLTSVSIFVSAMVQAEQVGASLAETLRVQSDDLRDRRKMRALLLAQALPVKLVFPLMFCFLPSLFYSTLGPVLAQFVDLADSLIKR